MSKLKELQSRFGFHPCNYQLYLKLKYLHKQYFRTLRQFHTWHRWWRREPQNRYGNEPMVCPEFIRPGRWIKPVSIANGAGTGFKIYPAIVNDANVVETYQRSRMPMSEPVTPFSAEQIAEIERLYVKVKTWMDRPTAWAIPVEKQVQNE